MFPRQEYDRQRFIARAGHSNRATLTVVTDARVIPRAMPNTNYVAMQPMVLLHYVLDLPENNGPAQRWVFEEVVDDNGGPLNLEGTVIHELRKHPIESLTIKVVDRTLSLPRT